MSFICRIIKNHFHKKGFALGLVLKQRLAASRKWPIIAIGVLSLFRDLLALKFEEDYSREQRHCSGNYYRDEDNLCVAME